MSVRVQSISVERVGEELRGLAANGKSDEALEMAIGLLTKLFSENQSLQLRVMKLLHERYGRSSERVDSAQLCLLLGELTEEAMQQAHAEPQEELVGAGERSDKPKEKKPGHGWNKLPKDLPVEKVVLPLDDAQRLCECGHPRHVIGHAMTQELDYLPGSFLLRLLCQEKGACRRCEDGVVTAAAPDKVIEGGRPGPGLLSHILTSKYADQSPLSRLRRVYLRAGIDIPVSTLSDWVKAAAEVIEPIAKRIREQVLEAHVVQTDATGLRVLDKERKPAIAKGTVWAYVGDGEKVAFDYTPTGEGEHPRRFLEGRIGWVQADAASVFDALYVSGKMVEAGCWAHGRRRFHAQMDRDRRAAKMVSLIGELYQIERQAGTDGMSTEERLTLRKERAPPLLDEIKRQCADICQRDPPKSDMAKAAAYVLNHWTALTRFLDDGRLKLDNNDVERALRTVAIGRKNYLFAGSHEAARRAAVIYTVLGTCRLVDVDPSAYLTDVLKKLAGRWPARRLDELMPARWKAAQSEAAELEAH
jgi:transposase